jgi:phosphoglycolate phosphatase
MLPAGSFLVYAMCARTEKVGALRYNEKSMITGKNAIVRAFIFDLDGTLLDTKLDLVNSVNAMLGETDRPELPTEVLASYVGHGAPQLIARVLGQNASEEQRREGLAVFLKHYDHQKLNLTRPYPGVVQGLHALSDYPMAVLTNKPRTLSVQILEGLHLAHFFRGIYGGDSFEKKKPDASGALSIVKGLGSMPKDTAMVGDSDVDIQTARNAGMFSVAVNYGFGQHNPQLWPADLYVDSLSELAPLALPRV